MNITNRNFKKKKGAEILYTLSAFGNSKEFTRNPQI